MSQLHAHLHPFENEIFKTQVKFIFIDQLRPNLVVLESSLSTAWVHSSLRSHTPSPSLLSLPLSPTLSKAGIERGGVHIS